MHPTDHALIGKAANIPSPKIQPIISFSPVVIPISDRTHELQVRVTAPSKGGDLPVVIFSHGHGPYLHLSSLEGYGPLAEYWAACGFVVIQPTHLSSKTIHPVLEPHLVKEIMMIDRVKDISRILDSLDTIEDTVPFLKGRIDKSRIAAAGHSLGGSTIGMALGVTNTDPRDGSKTEGYDSRVKAGIIIGGAGSGGADMSESGRKMFGYHNPDFSTMRTPALVVWGDQDVSPLFTIRDADWRNDAYTLAPGPKSSLKIKDCRHAFGGISGWDCSHAEGDDAVELLIFVQKMTVAYLRSQLYGDRSWEEAVTVLKKHPELGSVKEKA